MKNFISIIAIVLSISLNTLAGVPMPDQNSSGGAMVMNSTSTEYRNFYINDTFILEGGQYCVVILYDNEGELFTWYDLAAPNMKNIHNLILSAKMVGSRIQVAIHGDTMSRRFQGYNGRIQDKYCWYIHSVKLVD